jgi:glycosidase
MPWQPEEWNQELLTFYHQLVHLRRSLAALQHGKRVRLHVDAARQTYAYARILESGETAVALFNLSDTSQTIPLKNADSYNCLLSTAEMPEIIGDGVKVRERTAVLIVNRE